MNTISKVSRETKVLQGLKMVILENSHIETNTRVHVSTYNEDLSYSYEFDRTFNNVDVIEGIDINSMENPHTTKDAKYILNSFVPIKEYKNKIKLFEKYKEKVKG